MKESEYKSKTSVLMFGYFYDAWKMNNKEKVKMRDGRKTEYGCLKRKISSIIALGNKILKYYLHYA